MKYTGLGVAILCSYLATVFGCWYLITRMSGNEGTIRANIKIIEELRQFDKETAQWREELKRLNPGLVIPEPIKK